MTAPIAVTAHVDDAEIFLGVMPDQCERVYIAASPMRQDHLRVMEELRIQRAACWGTISEYWWKNRYLNIPWREQNYTAGAIYERIRWAINDQRTYYGTQEILTHNTWGEYGHIHHRRVSAAVCDLAIEFGLDVWAPSHVVSIEPGHLDWTFDDCGLETRVKHYPREVYEYRKYVYKKNELEMPSKMWTWIDYLPPPEEQTWIKLVDNGVDKRNLAVMTRSDIMPVYGV